MKIIWVCNSVLKYAANKLGIEAVSGISWVDSLIEKYYGNEQYELYIAFPINSNIQCKIVKDENITYCPFVNKSPNYKYNSSLEKMFEKLLKDTNPDVIHIFGTEFPHTLSMMKAVHNNELENKTILGIQGLCSFIARHYYAYLPNSVINRYTFRDFIKKDNIYQQQKKFYIRGEYEKEAIRLSKNVIGRTVWDKACIRNINQDVNYFECDEIMRDSFYNYTWSLDYCERNSIFISQSYYPLKGFHILIQAVTYLKNQYPNIKIYTTGDNIFNYKGYRVNSYTKYIRKLINKFNLKDNIIFLGYLNEKEMCDRYLKSHIFVSSSSIENSSNSLSEAMLLGVPCIASDVGGTISLFEHNKDGFLYQADAPYLLSYYIDQILKNDSLAKDFSTNSRKHALVTHDREKNNEKLLKIYGELAK